MRNRDNRIVEYLPQANSLPVQIVGKAIAGLGKSDFEHFVDSKSTRYRRLEERKIIIYDYNKIQFIVDVTQVSEVIAANSNVTKWFHYILNVCYQNYDIKSNTWKNEEIYIEFNKMPQNWYINNNTSHIKQGFLRAQKAIFNIGLYEVQLDYSSTNKKNAKLEITEKSFLSATPMKLFSILALAKKDGKTVIKITPDVHACWQAIFKFITYLPHYAYELSENAFGLVFYFASRARIAKNKVNSMIEIEFSYRRLSEVLGMRFWNEVKDGKGKILDPLTNAIREIMDADSRSELQYFDIRIEPVMKPYFDSYEHGKIRVRFLEHYTNKLKKRC